MLAGSMRVEEAVARLRRRVRDVGRPCVQVGGWVYARGARRRGYALHVMVVVVFMASWWEAHVFCWTGHNRLVGVCNNI